MLTTINDLRVKFNTVHPIFVDSYGNKAAEEYAQFLLENEPNEETFKEIAKAHSAVLNEGAYRVIVGNAILEEDTEPTDKYMKAEFMDAHGLLLELQEELKLLCTDVHSHIGVGFAANAGEVKVVELLSAKPCSV